MERATALADLLDHGFHAVVFQPILRLSDRTVAGYEALMRGPAGTPLAAPGPIFRDAAIDRSLLHRFDLACLLSAVRSGRVFPDDIDLFVNLHGETLVRMSHSGSELEELLAQLDIDPGRLVLEISELTDRSHVRSIARSLKPLRSRGMRIALDDVGVRYAWLHHMLWLEPEILKIDRQFVRRADKSTRKRRLLSALVHFCAEAGADIVAEGIETEGEERAVIAAGIALGQGFLLGRPAPVQAWMPATRETAERTRVAGLVIRGSRNA